MTFIETKGTIQGTSHSTTTIVPWLTPNHVQELYGLIEEYIHDQSVEFRSRNQSRMWECAVSSCSKATGRLTLIT